MTPLCKLYALSIMGVALLGFAFWREAGLLYVVLASMACGWTFGLTFAAHYIETMERSSSRLPSEHHS